MAAGVLVQRMMSVAAAHCRTRPFSGPPTTGPVQVASVVIAGSLQTPASEQPTESGSQVPPPFWQAVWSTYGVQVAAAATQPPDVL